ncbi:hypothetical protein HDU93_008206 [Gonapodya sp. JEL0774]|nr:hypothetical protein HDU93_008206 [Gonapodya sp. JEL0774]
MSDEVAVMSTILCWAARNGAFDGTAGVLAIGRNGAEPGEEARGLEAPGTGFLATRGAGCGRDPELGEADDAEVDAAADAFAGRMDERREERGGGEGLLEACGAGEAERAATDDGGASGVVWGSRAVEFAGGAGIILGWRTGVEFAGGGGGVSVASIAVEFAGGSGVRVLIAADELVGGVVTTEPAKPMFDEMEFVGGGGAGEVSDGREEREDTGAVGPGRAKCLGIALTGLRAVAVGEVGLESDVDEIGVVSLNSLGSVTAVC